MSDEKYVGPIAAAKNVALVKAELGKKLDKSGGTITGSLEINGSMHAGGAVQSDFLLSAPSVIVHNDAAEASVHINCSGDNAARITSLGSDGKSRYSRVAVGTPTGDNDAATKAYVDAGLASKASTETATQSAAGLMSAADKAKLDDVEAGANNITVDAALDAASENPVQNKAIKAALDNKLPTSGGNVSGTLSLTGGITVGRTKDDTGVHLYKDSVGVAKLTSGSADVNDNVAMARLKVADPTEGDDAVTKKYVDDRAVRYDAAQTLTSNQKYLACQNIGAVSQKYAFVDGDVTLQTVGNDDGVSVINITPGGKNNDYTLALDGGPENVPVRVSGIETPTDAQTDCAANVEYVKNKIAEVAASGGVDVDNALSATSTNPVQNKVVTAALTGKAGTAVATQSTNGLMSKADKAKLDGIAAGATKITVDSAMSGSSVNPVQNKVMKQYVDDKVAAAGSNITVDASLSSTSTNPVQNKAVKAALDGKASTAAATTSAAGLMSAADKSKLDGIASGATKVTVDSAVSASSTNPVQNKAIKAAIDAKADKTALDSKADKSALDAKADVTALDGKADKTVLDGKMDKAGGTFTGNVYGQYFVGTWLQTTAATDLGKTPGKIAVLDDSGWLYHRTPAELLADIGAATVSAMLDKAYPVGAIYMSVNSTNPQTLFGGTWVQIKDRFLLAAGTTYKAGTTGGEAAHALTADEMPNHQHVLWYPNAGGEQSAAIGYPEAGSKNTWYAEASKTGGAGGGAAHNNMPPYLSVYVWKRTA